MNIDEFRIESGSKKLDLSKIDPRHTPEWDPDDKDEARTYLLELNERLEALQESAVGSGHRERVLVVIQAMDAGGKDGTIRHVFEGVNPTGVKVASFKRPASGACPRLPVAGPQPGAGDGELSIFNRSHYEDVLVVRVKSSCREALAAPLRHIVELRADAGRRRHDDRQALPPHLRR